MKTQNVEQTAYQNATLKVEFRIHMIVYGVVNAFLLAINLLFTPEYLWVIWPVMGWGIGLLAHGIKVRLATKQNLKERMIAREMKKAGLLIAFAILSANTFAQDASEKTIPGYGGPFISATSINDNIGLIIGGKGGALFAEKMGFGGLGFGMVNAPVFSGDDFSENANADLTMSFGAGGVFFEYVLNYGAPIQVSVPLNIMAGGVHVYEELSKREIESTALFILEPGINIDFKLSGHYSQTLYISYRQSFGSSLANIEDAAISGLNVGLLFKFRN